MKEDDCNINLEEKLLVKEDSNLEQINKTDEHINLRPSNMRLSLKKNSIKKLKSENIFSASVDTNKAIEDQLRFKKYFFYEDDEDEDNYNKNISDMKLADSTEQIIEQMKSEYHSKDISQDNSLKKRGSNVSKISTNEYEKKVVSIISSSINSSNRTKVYLQRIYTSSGFIILLSIAIILVWIFLDLHKINTTDTVLTYISCGVLIICHFQAIVFITCFFKYTDYYVSNKKDTDSFMFKLRFHNYLLLFAFLINLLEALRVMIYSYVNYYNCK